MRVKPDLRIRKYIGKQVRMVVRLNDSCAISVTGKLYRGNRSEYQLLPVHSVDGGFSYFFFNARMVEKRLGFGNDSPTFALKTAKIEK